MLLLLLLLLLRGLWVLQRVCWDPVAAAALAAGPVLACACGGLLLQEMLGRCTLHGTTCIVGSVGGQGGLVTPGWMFGGWSGALRSSPTTEAADPQTPC